MSMPSGVFDLIRKAASCQSINLYLTLIPQRLWMRTCEGGRSSAFIH